MGIPVSHPKRVSLGLRHRLVDGLRAGFVAEAGLLAHGRGEAFDYLLGERTSSHANRACEAAAALLLCSNDPVLSINGNVAALCPSDIVHLARVTESQIEVNLFYRTPKREKQIAKILQKNGAGHVFGLTKKHKIPGLGSQRANVDDALWAADTVLVMLEDGDRTEAMRKIWKNVIAVDLNPLSRTAQTADITIVDNVVRALPLIIQHAKKLKNKDDKKLHNIIRKFDNAKNLEESEKIIRRGFKTGH